MKKFNWCGWKWGFSFIKLKNRIEKLPFVNPKKLNKLYKDIEVKCCYPHDLAFDKWGWVKDFVVANYMFCENLMTLLHWTLPISRLIIFITTFTALNLFWIKYFNWK